MLVLLVRRGGGFGASLFMSKYFGGWGGCLLIVIKTREQERDKKNKTKIDRKRKWEW